MARAMKDSGIEWIGEIPEGWGVVRNKSLFYEVDDRCISGSDYTLLSVSEYTGVTPRSAVIKEGEFETHAESLDGYKICKPGDIVMNIMLAWKRATAASNYEGIISPAYCVFRGKGINTKFFHYLFRTDNCAEMFKRYSTGIIDSRLRLYPDVFMSLYSIVPPSAEQTKIVSFLDAECSRIDAVIEQTRASIEEYKKLKQSVITQAVTKGIRPGRKMKASGVEWIGEIPEDWRFTKTLNCLSMPITDGPHTTPELFDEGIAFISAEAVSCGNGRIDFSHKRGYISQEYYEECCKKYIPEIDDIYMIKSGATTGRVSIVDTLEPTFTIWSPLAVFRCNREMMAPRFLYYALQSKGFQKQVEFGWTFGTQQNIGMRTLEQLKVCVPQVEEQKEIVEYLDKKCAEIDSLIHKKQQFLAELESYKKSLIFEYVTGKKEVCQ